MTIKGTRRCGNHIDSDAADPPMFLQYRDCDVCEQLFIFRRKSTGQRRALRTRRNRSFIDHTVYFFHASELPKRDPWYRAATRRLKVSIS